MSDLPDPLIDACCCFFGLDRRTICVVDDYWKMTPLEIAHGVFALFNNEFIPRFPEFKFRNFSDFWAERCKFDANENKGEKVSEKIFPAPLYTTGRALGRILGITGEMRHGKSTLTAELVKRYGFTEYAFAQPLKRGCAILFNFTDEQLYQDQKEQVDLRWGITPRKVLQVVGTDLFRNLIHVYLPKLQLKHTLWIENFIRWQSAQSGNIVVSDVRFMDECEVIQNMNGIVVRIVRPSLINRKDEKHTHASETSTSLLPVNHTIYNDSTLDALSGKIDQMITEMIRPTVQN